MLRRESILRRLQPRHQLPLKAPDQHPPARGLRLCCCPFFSLFGLHIFPDHVLPSAWGRVSDTPHPFSAPLTRDSTRKISVYAPSFTISTARVRSVRAASMAVPNSDHRAFAVLYIRVLVGGRGPDRLPIRTAKVTALWSEDVKSRTTCHSSAQSSTAELHAVTSTTPTFEGS
ncbi:hypothetical protein EVAR_57868_1 [Eumeta japonica]|uniref:Uncharacterized protein n=1 Tax=Eumeta variegata TaxID=151549 RepID=A0A4C1ZGC6_EUMVA|nr:hypothetical protein EVAR_57868_1 [Eumeta japonica]